MGDLILFRPLRNFVRSSEASSQPQDARILFFTGVRYTREAEPSREAIDQQVAPKGGMDGTGGRRRKRRG